MLSYTWSKAIDDASSFRWSEGDSFQPLDQYNAHPNRGISAYDVGRRLAASLVYELPIGLGKPFLNHGGMVNAVLGGWQLGTVATFIDGSPTSVGNIPWNGDSGSNRPDATGLSPIPDSRGISKFWDNRTFNWTDPGLQYRRGNTARNTLLGPGTRSWDFSAAKNFRIIEGHALQFRFEAFNFPNHPNWNRPSADVRSSLFGLIQTAKTMRELQFALKYSF